MGAGFCVRRAEITTGWIASAPATFATLADYAGRNFETESAVPNTLPLGRVKGTLGHRRRFSSGVGKKNGREAGFGLRAASS